MTEKSKRIVHIAAHMGGGAGKAISGLICEADKKHWSHSIILLEAPADNRYVDCCIHAGIKVMLADDTDKSEMTRFLNHAEAIVINWWGHPLMPGFITDHLSGISSRWFFWFHINGCSYPYIPYELPADSFASFFTSRYSLENPLWSGQERNYIKDNTTIVNGMGNFLPSGITPKMQYCSQRLHIGYAGTISYSKMDRQMLGYLSEIHSHIPELLVTLAGECGEEIRSEIIEKNMDGFVSCTGLVNDIFTYYRQFDIFLYLLNPENYGTTENVLLEAMAAGLPIIVWNNPVERTIIKHGQNGYIVENGKQLLELVAALNADEGMRKAAGYKAREYVCREYDAKENRKKYLSILSEHCKKAKAVYPFDKNIGTTPYQWFANFTGKNKEKFAQLFVKTSLPDDDFHTWIKELPPIYTGIHKSSIYHFLKYYPQDPQLQQISRQIQSFQTNKLEENR